MKSRAGRPILVTGSHRSGSTWVGRMLAAAPGVVYLHEPFSPSAKQPPRPNPRFDVWFAYINSENEALYRGRIDRLMGLRYPWWGEVCAWPSPREALGSTRRALGMWQARLRGARPLLKDPIALMSAGWLAERYDAQVLVLIRHPCAFVTSIVRKNWWFDYNELLRQPLLMRDLLAPYEEEMRRLARVEHDLVENSAVLWRIIHHVIAVYQQRHPEWAFVWYEELASDPLGWFEKLYGYFGLPLSEQARATIERHSSAPDEPVQRGQVGQIRRNSQAEAWSWKERMPSTDVERVRALTGEVGERFYSQESWDLMAV